MSHVPLLNELTLIAVIGVFITPIFSKLKLPAVAGHLASGALIGLFGLAGREAARTWKRCGIRPIVLELNAAIVRQAKTKRQPVFYGDATSEEAMGHAHLFSAR